MNKLTMGLVLTVLQCSFVNNCFADGTVDFNEYVAPIIKQRPFFANFMFKTFDFDTSAVGVTIGENVSHDLGGTRIGPYRVCAKLKETQGLCTMEVVVDTNQHFFGADGRELDGPEGAKTVKEDFYAIEINPLSSGN